MKYFNYYREKGQKAVWRVHVSAAMNEHCKKEGFTSVSFDDWWKLLADDVKERWTEKGPIVDPDWGELDAKTGEPVK